MNKKIRELRRKLAALIQQARAMLDKADAEERSLNNDEQEAYDALYEQIEALQEDIARRERQAALEDDLEKPADPATRNDPGKPDEDPRIGMSRDEVRNYRLVRAIRAAASGDWRGAELEREASQAVAERTGRDPQSFFLPYDVMVEPLDRSLREQRDLVVGTPSAGGDLVATDLLSMSFIELLRNKMVLRSAGSKVLAGLVGDVAIPRQTGGGTAYWVDEGNAPTESQQAVDQVPLDPKTLGAFTDISRKLLKQSSIDVEMFVREDLATILAIELDRAGLHGSGVAPEPTGIVNQTGVAVVAIGANGGAPLWQHIVDLEREVAVDNAELGALAYITNPKVRGKLKQTEKATGTAQFVWERGNSPLNGYPAPVTNQVRSDLTKGTGSDLSAIFYGNWGDVVLGMWGVLDILVDPYSLSTTGAVRVVEFQEADWAVRHGESFAVVLDADTT